MRKLFFSLLIVPIIFFIYGIKPVFANNAKKSDPIYLNKKNFYMNFTGGYSYGSNHTRGGYSIIRFLDTQTNNVCYVITPNTYWTAPGDVVHPGSVSISCVHLKYKVIVK